MYLRKITLRNVKCFQDVTIDFSQGAGVRKWTTLFGKNGLGKSTLLQAIGAVLAGPSALHELLPVAGGWVRQGAKYGEIEAEILGSEDDFVGNKRRERPYVLRYIVSGADPKLLPPEIEEKPSVPEFVAWSGDESSKSKENITKDRKLLSQIAFSESTTGWLACGYGPFRRLTGGAQAADEILWASRRSAQFITLFREDAALTNATKWLIELYNLSRDGDQPSNQALELVKRAIAERLFPDTVTLEVTAKSAMLRNRMDEPVSFFDLSDGYRSMLALSIDLLRWIVKAFPNSEHPLLCSGVVVIDEIDAHLHPSWQRTIGDWIRGKFPNIQFIITTHSPFVAQVATVDETGEKVTPADFESSASGNIRLTTTPKGVIAEVSTEAAQLLLPDQILQSELFDMGTLYSPFIEGWLADFENLRSSKRPRSPDEESRYEQLNLFLENLPGASSQEGRKVAKRIRAKLRGAARKISGLK